MKKSDNKGFALFFLIAVFLVVSALIGAGITMIGPRVRKAKYDRSGEILTAATQSVISWSVINGRLPDAATFPLLLPSSIDDWGRALVYIYDNNLTSSATGGICGRQSTGLLYGAVTNTAFIIVSGAEDLTVNTTPSVSGAYAGTVAPATADIVRFVSLENLKNQTGCFGFTSGMLKILNNELPDAVSGTLYTAKVYADGGVPFAAGGEYKWCIKGTLPNGVINPTPGCSLTAGCGALNTESSSQWLQADSLTITGTPTTGGTINILVRDNNDNNTALANDNCNQRSFVITINP